jgi:hypothetical protein
MLGTLFRCFVEDCGWGGIIVWGGSVEVRGPSSKHAKRKAD